MPSLVDVLHRAVVSGARAVAVKSAKKPAMIFDARHPAAERWASERAGELVTAITDDARAAVRAVVHQGFEHGLPVRAIAKTLRATLGLTERDAQAVMNRQVKLLAEGVESERASAAAERYAEKLARGRALTIARTETMRAANEGQLQLWRQAQDSGLLSRGARKVWITADPCPICAPLEGETALVDEDFSVGQDPPLHVRCRCTIGLVA